MNNTLPRFVVRARARVLVALLVGLTVSVAGITPVSAVGLRGTGVDAASSGSRRTPSPTSVGPVRTRVGVAPTSLPAPRSAGTPLRGWERIADDEWPEPGTAVVVHPVGRGVDVSQTPTDQAARLRFENGRASYGQTTFLLLGERGDWLRVALPVRPNGTVGWVRRADVTTATVHERIVVELSTNVLTFERDGQPLVVERIAAGTGGTPTPKGLFFVKEIVPQSNPNGALGPVALGLSGFSEVLMSFAGGDGVIGIHGTNAPGKLGGDVSHGCIRASNDTIRWIAAHIALGTPVEIANARSDLPSRRILGADTTTTVAPPTSAPENTTTTSTIPPLVVPQVK